MAVACDHVYEICWWTNHPAEFLIAFCVIVLQAALIAGLLIERRRARVAAAALHAQRADLAHASRLAMVGELAASIAHEVNQPLGAILSNADAAEMLLERPDPQRLEEVRAILADIRADDLRASEVVKRVRALVRKEAQRHVPLDLAEVCRDVERMVHLQAQRRHVSIAVRTAPALVLGEAVQLQQVVLNLVLNAMEASRDLPERRRRVTIDARLRDDHVAQVVVADDGHGIDPQRIRVLFESFFTTKEDGMGLGLSIARSIIAEHGGRLWAESNGVRGAMFCFTLPVHSVAVPDGAATPRLALPKPA